MEGVRLPHVKDIPREFMDLGKRLVFDRKDKKITLKEFEKEVTYLALNCGFNELRFKPAPSRPQILFEYDNLSFEQKRKVNEDSKFWQNPTITSYMKSLRIVDTENYTSKWWLGVLYDRLSNLGDIVNANRVKQRLDEFEGWSFIK